ncbi:MAG: hypothetical protein ACE5Q6_14005 [Dehalococcoidia bacterium]
MMRIGPFQFSFNPNPIASQRFVLPVSVVVVFNNDTMDSLRPMRNATTEIKAFYDAIGIELKPQVYGHQALEDMFTFDQTQEKNIIHEHFWKVHVPTPALYIARVSPTVSGGNLGDAARGTGIAMVAGGAVDAATNKDLVHGIMIHELGHLLGLSHQEGTFMRTRLEIDNNFVTPEQQQTMRDTAATYGIVDFD